MDAAPLSRRGRSSDGTNGVARGVPGDPRRTRWLAKAEVDHGGHDAAAESGAREPGAGAAVAKAVAPADRDANDGARPGKDGPRAGGAGHAPQTELAESEAVSGDRTRPPQTKGPKAVPPTGLANCAFGPGAPAFTLLSERGGDVRPRGER
jgi:hypothetical protein